MSNKRTREKRRRWMRHSVYKAQPFRFDQLRYGYGWTCVEQGTSPAHVRAFIGDREIDYPSLCDAMIKSVASVSGLRDIVETQRRCNALDEQVSEHMRRCATIPESGRLTPQTGRE